MIIVADTSALMAVFARRDPDHERCAEFFNAAGRDFIYSPLVMTELDHLIRARTNNFSIAQAALRALVDRVTKSYDEFAPLGLDDFAQAADIRDKYADMELDLADALGVVLAARYDTNRIFTLDESDFRRLSPLDKHSYFEILPTDNPS
jgi:predicted nucleic acid-binding protein